MRGTLRCSVNPARRVSTENHAGTGPARRGRGGGVIGRGVHSSGSSSSCSGSVNSPSSQPGSASGSPPTRSTVGGLAVGGLAVAGFGGGELGLVRRWRTRSGPRGRRGRRWACPRARARGRPRGAPCEPVHARRALDDVEQRRRGHGLEQVPEGAVLDGLHGALDGGAARHEDHGHVEIGLADGAQEREAVHVGHGDVADDDVEALILRERRRLAAVVRDRHAVAGGRERARIAPRGHRLIVDDEHLGFGFFGGDRGQGPERCACRPGCLRTSPASSAASEVPLSASAPPPRRRILGRRFG